MQAGFGNPRDKNTGAGGRVADRNVYCVLCKMPMTAKHKVEGDVEHVTVAVGKTAGLPFFGWVHKCCLSKVQQPDFRIRKNWLVSAN